MFDPRLPQTPAEFVLAKHIAEFEYMWEELPTEVMEHYLDKALRMKEALSEEGWYFASVLDTVEPISQQADDRGCISLDTLRDWHRQIQFILERSTMGHHLMLQIAEEIRKAERGKDGR